MATRVGEAWYEIGARVDRLEGALGQADKRIRDSGDHAERGFFSRITGGLGGIGGAALTAAAHMAVVGAAGVVALGGLGVLAVRQAANMESMAVSWEVMLGSAEAAQARMAELREFAATTPFEIPEVMNASRTLQVFGGTALATGENLRLVGDIASGTQQPFSDVAMWIGRSYDAIKSGQPFGEAAMRLQEMGAMSGEGRRQLEDLAQAVKDGTMTMDEAWPQAQAVFGQFSGMMEKQSQTMSGQWSNMMDAIGQGMVKVGELLLPMAKEWVQAIIAAIPAITDFLIGVFTRAQPVLEAVGAAVGYVIGLIRTLADDWTDLGRAGEQSNGWLGDFEQALFEVLSVVQQVWPEIQKRIELAMDVAGQVVTLFVREVWPLLQQAFETALAVSKAVWPVIEATVRVAMSVITAVVEALAPVVERAFTFIAEEVVPPLQEAFAAIAAWVEDNWPMISRVIDAAAQAIGTAFSVLLSVIEAVWPIIVQVAEVVLPLLGVALQVLLPILENLLNAFSTVWTAIGEVVTWVVDNVITPVVTAVLGFFTDTFLPAIENVGAVFSAVWSAVGSFFTALWNGLLQFFGGIVGTIIGIIGNLIGVVAQIPGPFQEGAQAAQGALAQMQADVETWGTATAGSFSGTYEEHRRLAQSAGERTMRAYGDALRAQGEYVRSQMEEGLRPAARLVYATSPPPDPDNPFHNIDRDAERTARAYADTWRAQRQVIRDAVGSALGGAETPALSLQGATTRRVEVELVHRVVDPGHVLSGLPGGAEAVAGQLQRALDASGLLGALRLEASVT